jgi:hypothetical protein
MSEVEKLFDKMHREAILYGKAEILIIEADKFCILEAKLEIAVKALEECRKTSKVSEPTIDKLIIRNITGLALSQIKEKASEALSIYDEDNK